MADIPGTNVGITVYVHELDEHVSHNYIIFLHNYYYRYSYYYI